MERGLPADGPDDASKPPAQDTGVYTPAHPTVFDAVKEFFNSRPTPSQPIAFTHKVHLANGLQCANCHVGVDQGPDARIPSVNFCMTCHQVIAKDKPEIKKVAAYQARGEDIPWQRVYGFEPSAHVKFNHAPHIRAGVQCATCHGDMTTADSGRAKSESHDGILHRVPPAKEGVGGLRDVPFLEVRT